MRLRVRTAVTALILGAIGVSAVGADRLWRGVAERNSRTLVTLLVTQITQQVRNDFWADVAGIEQRFETLRERLRANAAVLEVDPDLRLRRLHDLVGAQASFGWIAHIGVDGSAAALRRASQTSNLVLEIKPRSIGGALGETRQEAAQGAPLMLAEAVEATVDPRAGGWFTEALASSSAAWRLLEQPTPFERAEAVYAAAIDARRPELGVLAAFARPDDLARLIGAAEVGKSGAVFMIGPDGRIVVTPDPAARKTAISAGDEARLQRAAEAAGARIAARPASARNIVETVRLEAGGETFAAALSPLEFRDRQLAVIIPEREFLEEIEATTRRVAWAVLGLIAVAALASVWLARRYVVAPIRGAVADLGAIEALRFSDLPRRASPLAEFDALQSALLRVGAGLSAFAKYIPIDLVRSLLAEGMEARPGGEQRQVTVMFADIEGFTGMSERMGPDIVPIVSAYFEAMTGAIAAHDGVVDKFIGDAVMAFWGAPKTDEDQAANACRAALACLAAVRAAGLRDDSGAPLRVRIGVNTGLALVGNIGSDSRLNYTVIGDSVNVASRLEGANKLYGTSILVGETTRAAASGLAFREVDCAAVKGRAGGLALFEPLAEDDVGPWLERYAAALASYRAGDFSGAAARFRETLALRPGDSASERMAELCDALIAAPPANWSGVTVMTEK